MTLRPRKPIPKPKKQVQVDLKNAETMKCAKCGNSIFIQGYVIKKISAIMIMMINYLVFIMIE